ncbi:MAG: outer membrane beta-barrel protein [Sulfuriferula sp.]
MHKLTQALIFAGVLASPVMTLAEGAPATPAPTPAAVPTLSDVLNASNISVTGYLDAGYTSLNSTGLFTTKGATRVFDAPKASAGHNFDSFNLNQAAVTVAMQPKEGFGGLVNLTAGQDAQVIASVGEGLKSVPSGHYFDITQAYLSYVTGPLTIIGGKFVTASGAEVIASPSDTNYSRSILFGYAIPFTHTGVRATYAVNDTLSLIAGINNGWDQVSDLNTDKTVELGFIATPVKMFSLAGTFYGGKELSSFPVTGGANGMRNLYDLVATINATDQLTFVLNYDYATQENVPSVGKAKWDGLAAYANYQFNDQWRISLRGEYFNDTDGFRTGIAQKWKEGTFTVAYMPTKHVELRAEVRKDKSDKPAFLTTAGTGKDSQTSAGLEAIYKF